MSDTKQPANTNCRACGHSRAIHYRAGSEQGGGCDLLVTTCQCKGFIETEAHRALSPEMAARVTASVTALRDYHREYNQWITEGGTLDFASWAGLLGQQLGSILEQLGAEL